MAVVTRHMVYYSAYAGSEIYQKTPGNKGQLVLHCCSSLLPQRLINYHSKSSKQTNNLTMGHLMYYYTTGSSTFKIIVCHKIQHDNCTVNFFPILSALTLPDAVPALI